MRTGDRFQITYFSFSDNETISRQGKWTQKCRIWKSATGTPLLTYYDLEKEDYRCASIEWTIDLL